MTADENICSDCRNPKSRLKFCPETGLSHGGESPRRHQLSVAYRSKQNLKDAKSASDHDEKPQSPAGSDPGSEGSSEDIFGEFAQTMPEQAVQVTSPTPSRPESPHGVAQNRSQKRMQSLRRVSFKHGEEGDDQAWNTFRKASVTSIQGMQRSMSRGSAASLRGRNMSLATLAVTQNKRNNAYMLRQGFNLRELENQREELENFVENEEWANDAGLGLGGWKAACLQTMVTTRKAANLMLKGVRSRSLVADMDQGRRVRRAMDHRSVMNCGPMAQRLEEAKVQSTLQAQEMLGEAHDTLSSSGRQGALGLKRPCSAPVGTRDFNTQSRRFAVRDGVTPAMAAWKKHSRHLPHDPTMLSLAGTMPDNLQVLTTKVNWTSLLDQQRDQFDKLEASDASYRSMLDKYQKYQMLVQLRLEKVLSSLT